jgi:hypothetical protein
VKWGADSKMFDDNILESVQFLATKRSWINIGEKIS